MRCEQVLDERFHLTPKLIVRIIVGAAALAVVSGCTVGMPWRPDTSGTSYHAHR